MSLSPNSSEASFASEPSAKLSININAFNGNTTNFNRGPAPRPKSVPTQPRATPNFGSFNSNLSPGMIRPM